MKKLLGIVALSLAIILPVSASAAEVKLNCDKSQKVCDESGTKKCTSTCTISITGNTQSLTDFNATLDIVGDDVSITSITPGDGWTSLTSSTSGKSVPISFMASNGGVTASDFLLATVTMELGSSASNCSLQLRDPSVGKNVEVEVTTEVKQTQTGASLPVAIIAVGACAAIVIYGATRKNKKMYKI